jgi:hypothetical protein
MKAPAQSRRVLGALLHLAAAVSLALCAATALAWARGGWTDNRFHDFPGRWSLAIDARSGVDGNIQIVIVHWWRIPIVAPFAGSPDPLRSLRLQPANPKQRNPVPGMWIAHY